MPESNPYASPSTADVSEMKPQKPTNQTPIAQRFGFRLIATANLANFKLLLMFGMILFFGYFDRTDKSLISSWICLAMAYSVITLVGKLSCGFSQSQFGPTTYLTISVVLELFMLVSLICLLLGITIPETDGLLHHAFNGGLFVLSSLCFVCWLNAHAKITNSDVTLKFCSHSINCLKYTIGCAICFSIFVNLGLKVGVVTKAIALTLLGLTAMFVLGFLALQTIALFNVGKQFEKGEVHD